MRKYIVPALMLIILTACGTASPGTTPATPQTAPVTAAPTSATGAASATPAATTEGATPSVPYPGPQGAYPAPTGAATVPTAPASGGTTAPTELVTAARDRLAQYLKVEARSLNLQSASAQEWPNTAIGCPAPDQSYMAVIVPGFLLTFGDGSRTYDVHTSLLAARGEPMVLCENKLPVDLALAATPASPNAGAQVVVELAKQDLAKALGIDVSAITLESTNPVEWNDSSLGCPKPGQSYLQVVTSGYLVKLSANGQTYEYHTDTAGTVIRCLP